MRISKRRQPRIARLATVDLFAGCTRQELARIDRLATEIHVEAGRVLQREGGDANAFCVIAAGEATVSLHEKASGRLRSGSFFGEQGLLDRGPDTATITAAAPMTVFVFGRAEFAGLIAVAPPVARAIMRALATRARTVNTTRPQTGPARQLRRPIQTRQKAKGSGSLVRPDKTGSGTLR